MAALDIEQPRELLAYLRAAGRLREDAPVTVLAGGVSNRTVKVGPWVLKQALPKLRVQVDWFCDPARIRREALGLQWLGKLLPDGAVPRLVFEDPEHQLLAMEAVPEPHENFKTVLLAGRVDLTLVREFGSLLRQLHRLARERRAELQPLFADRSFFEALRLEPYYAYTASQVPEAAPFLHALIRETRACDDTLVHGDYSPKNVLVRDGRLVLLDHEVVHWGDGDFDVGFAMAHFLSKAHHLPERRGHFAAAARTISEGSGPRAVRHTLACLLARVAGRSPLEYLSADERARQRDAVVALLPTPPPLPPLIDAFLERL